MARWLLVIGTVAVLAAVGGFLALQPLSAADQYASVGSLLVAVVSFALATLTHLRAGGGSGASGRHTTLHARAADYRQDGDDNRFLSNREVRLPPGSERNGVVQSGGHNVIEVNAQDQRPDALRAGRRPRSAGRSGRR